MNTQHAYQNNTYYATNYVAPTDPLPMDGNNVYKTTTNKPLLASNVQLPSLRSTISNIEGFSTSKSSKDNTKNQESDLIYYTPNCTKNRKFIKKDVKSKNIYKTRKDKIVKKSTPSSNTIQQSTNRQKPKVIEVFWESENTLCYQMTINNVSVARRIDNDMINGTKLLNVTDMSRGRRDGILKNEQVKHVVKSGSMHWKGIWIPFDRAYTIAKKEKVVHLLVPLFSKKLNTESNTQQFNKQLKSSTTEKMVYNSPITLQNGCKSNETATNLMNNSYVLPYTTYQYSANGPVQGNTLPRYTQNQCITNSPPLYMPFSQNQQQNPATWSYPIGRGPVIQQVFQKPTPMIPINPSTHVFNSRDTRIAGLANTTNCYQVPYRSSLPIQSYNNTYTQSRTDMRYIPTSYNNTVSHQYTPQFHTGSMQYMQYMQFPGNGSR